MLSLNWNSVQQASCGGGKRTEKLIRKCFLSVLCFRDATSAMLLNMPDMCSTERSAVWFSCSRTASALCSTERSAVWFSCSRTASALRIRAAIGEVLVRNLLVHATAGKLSHQIAMLLCFSVFVSAACSNTNHCRRMPVNSRSEMVSCPALLADEQNHTIVIMLAIPLNQTPPTPNFDASTKPWYCGRCSTSSLTWVGLRPTYCNKADQSRRMLRNSSVMVMYCWCVLSAFARYRSTCPKIGFPHGMEIDANCSRPCSFWKSRSSNRLPRRTYLRSARISLHFF
jgi:hypothetical protein